MPSAANVTYLWRTEPDELPRGVACCQYCSELWDAGERGGWDLGGPIFRACPPCKRRFGD